MFLMDAVHGGLIKPEGELANVKEITRKYTNTEKTYWHDFVLKPSKESTAEKFVAEMRGKEEEFQKYVSRSLKL